MLINKVKIGVPTIKKIYYIAIIILVLFLLIVKISYLKWYIINSPYYKTLIWDSIDYDFMAQKMLSESFWSGEVFIIPPGYSIFLALIYKIFGRTFLAIILIQNLMTLISIVVIAMMVKRLYGNFVSLISVILYGLYGVIHFYDNKLIDNSLLQFLLILSVYFYIEKIIYKKSSLYLFLSGLALGYVCLIKPNFILMFIGYLAFIIFNKERALKYLVIMFTALIIIILPVAVRNYLISKSPVLISAYGGLAFYAGNKEGAKPYFEGLPISATVTSVYHVISNYVQEETGLEMSAAKISNYYYKKAVRYIINHPKEWIELALRKILLSLGNYEQEANYSYDLEENPYKGFYVISYALIVALAIIGVFVSDRENATFIILIPMVVVYLTLALLYMIPRLRVPAIAFLCIFGAIALEKIVFICKRVRKLVLVILMGVIIVISLMIKPPYPYNLQANEYVQYGLAYLNLRNYKQAEHYFRKAIELQSNFGRAYASLGLLYKSIAQDQKALEAYKIALKYAENDAETHNNIASIYFRNNNIEMAEKYLTKAYELNPYHASILYNMAILKLAKKDKEQAAYYYNRAMKYGAVDNANLAAYLR